MAPRNLRADAREIFSAGLKSADPYEAVLRQLEVRNDCLQAGGRTYELAAIRRIYVAGFGKAAAPMARAVETVLSDRISDGIVVVKYGHKLPLERIRTVEAGHPIPDERGLYGARQIVELAGGCGTGDLLIVLVSGGGSALLVCPADKVSLDHKRRTTEVLLKSGASIHDINAVRKHISRVKGGRLAQLAAPAQVIALILSDVIDDSLEAIASGPTVPDSTSYADCLEIIKRHDRLREIPPPVVDWLERGANGRIPETPKPSNPLFQRVHNIIVANNRSAIAAAQGRAESLGYHTRVLTNAMTGESRTVAKSHAALVENILRQHEDVSRPACLISAGETTVTVLGEGLGGRNQEFCLAAAMEIAGLDGVVILSAGTDGTDGPTDAAGAIVDGSTIERGRAKKLEASEFLARNDSYHFLNVTDDLLITGPTLTNVMDLQITLVS